MLDTNIVIYTTKNKPIKVREKFEQFYGQLCVSTVVVMELIYGAEKSAKPETNLSVIEGFLARIDVLAYDEKAAINTGQIRANLAKQGKPVGPYDQMIAGHARSQGLILVSNNQREFERVPGLMLENWI